MNNFLFNEIRDGLHFFRPFRPASVPYAFDRNGYARFVESGINPRIRIQICVEGFGGAGRGEGGGEGRRQGIGIRICI